MEVTEGMIPSRGSRNINAPASEGTREDPDGTAQSRDESGSRQYAQTRTFNLALLDDASVFKPMSRYTSAADVLVQTIIIRRCRRRA
jgi:hypothetical protein